MLLSLGLLATACSGAAPRELGGPGSASPSPSSSLSPPTKTPAPGGNSTPKSSSAPKASPSSKGTPSKPPKSCPSPDVPADGMLLPAFDCTGVAGAAILVMARVTGDASKRCVWVVDVNGTHHAALWRPGSWARFDPVRIYEAGGNQVWSELDPPRDIGGGFGPDYDPPRIPAQCRVEDHPDPWYVAL